MGSAEAMVGTTKIALMKQESPSVFHGGSSRNVYQPQCLRNAIFFFLRVETQIVVNMLNKLSENYPL
jgi:hypothetical protein